VTNDSEQFICNTVIVFHTDSSERLQPLVSIQTAQPMAALMAFSYFNE
jgi:hypothetical protein